MDGLSLSPSGSLSQAAALKTSVAKYSDAFDRIGVVATRAWEVSSASWLTGVSHSGKNYSGFVFILR